MFGVLGSVSGQPLVDDVVGAPQPDHRTVGACDVEQALFGGHPLEVLKIRPGEVIGEVEERDSYDMGLILPGVHFSVNCGSEPGFVRTSLSEQFACMSICQPFNQSCCHR